LAAVVRIVDRCPRKGGGLSKTDCWLWPLQALFPLPSRWILQSILHTCPFYDRHQCPCVWCTPTFHAENVW
jgi:hypothetical protein